MTERAWLGIDVGWVFPAADSDGNVYEWTRRIRPTEPSTQAGPVTIRMPDGTVRVHPAYPSREAATIAARASNVRAQKLAGSIVAFAASTGRGIALEDWSSFERRKKAWTRVYGAIADRAERKGVSVTQVDRAYTSITCPSCDHKGRENRATRDRFECVMCAFSGHADVVAAMNIARKAEGTFVTRGGVCVNPICTDVAWKAGACIFCYGFRWRKGHLPSARDLVARAEAPDLKKYRDQMRAEAVAERRERRDAATTQRQTDSYRTHDAWGEPLRGA